MSDNSDFVLPTEIPWEQLKSGDLEETVYWLLDALGAKDLEWRRGGSGQGAADQGRDLQAVFQNPTPDGSFEAQRWWIEAKGRERTVERRAVQAAVADAEVHGEIDVLVIATNASFSNPVRDWLTMRATTHRRPLVKLWDRDVLEKMLCRHPSVVARLFAKALSPQGRLEAVRTRFWNNASFASAGTLGTLWGNRKELEFSEGSLLALIASEVANGQQASRQWILEFDESELVAVFMLALQNTLYFLTRADDSGGSSVMSRTLGYLLVLATKVLGAEPVVDLTNLAFQFSDGRAWPQEVRDMVLPVITSGLLDDFFWACESDCTRISVGSRKEDSPADYWQRYRKSPSDKSDTDERYLFIEKIDGPCKVGFSLGPTRGCPLHEPPANFAEVIKVIDRVVKFRAR